MDPGTALAVVQMGIQAGQGLLAYYAAVRDSAKDISDTYASIESLTGILCSIKKSLKALARSDGSDARLGDVCASVLACNDGVDRLRKKLQKVRKYELPSGLAQKAFAAFQKACYPLHADTLSKLRSTVADVRGLLSSAIQALQLDVSVGQELTLNNVDHRVEELVTMTDRIDLGVRTLLTAQQQSAVDDIVSWLAAPDPWVNHNSARRLHMAGTGEWLFRHATYQAWTRIENRLLWIHGKAGCCKTVLCSTIVEDVLNRYHGQSNYGVAFFYLSFSDTSKQTYHDVLLAFVVQLCRAGWVPPDLQAARTQRNAPSDEMLEEALVELMKQRRHTFLMIDALDESPENDDRRLDIMMAVQQILKKNDSVSFLITSRPEDDIRTHMQESQAKTIPILESSVNDDIEAYVTEHLKRDGKLSKLNGEVRRKVVTTFRENGDGMFRWAYCQLQELKRMRCLRPKDVEQILQSLPKTLDETYERMLCSINDMHHDEALKALQFLAFSDTPLTMLALEKACATGYESPPYFDEDNIIPFGDLLAILSSLVLVYKKDSSFRGELDGEHSNPATLSEIGSVTGDMYIRLAHFSVKEFLTSERIQQSAAASFYLEEYICHWNIAQTCVAFLLHDGEKPPEEAEDLATDHGSTFQRYAIESWASHQGRVERRDLYPNRVGLTLDLLHSGILTVLSASPLSYRIMADFIGSEWSPMLFACYRGLSQSVQVLCNESPDLNSSNGGLSSTPLQAAIWGTQKTVVRILLAKDANVNAWGLHGTALQAAGFRGSRDVVEMLLAKGADVNALGGEYGTALQAAALQDSRDVIEMLLAKGADVNAPGGENGTALQTAARYGYRDVVEMLLAKGADVNAPRGKYGTALQAAAFQSSRDVVEMLLAKGADVNARGGRNGTALQVAVRLGSRDIVEMLLANGADVNAPGGKFGTALQAAAFWGSRDVVEMLLAKGADMNALGGTFGTALQAAALAGNQTIVEMLIAHGALEYQGWTSRDLASGSSNLWPRNDH